MNGDDAELVALIDNELDGDAKGRMLARLAGDEELRKRYEALRDAGAPIAGSLEALLRQAPVSRLRAGLPPEVASRAVRWPFSGVALRDLAAGFVLGLLAAGAMAWAAINLAPREESENYENWRSAVAEYTDLYTKETFSSQHPDPSLAEKELADVGERVGAHLTPESVALPDLRFTVAFMLAYDGSPLGAIAYVDKDGAPVMFCIIANGASDAPVRTERRSDLSVGWWSRGGRSHLVIGRMTEEHAAELARTLESRV